MANIPEITKGTFSRRTVVNQLIRAINALNNMTVREGSEDESPKLVIGDSNAELITTASGTSSSTEGEGTFTLDVVKDNDTAGTATFNGSGVN